MTKRGNFDILVLDGRRYTLNQKAQTNKLAEAIKMARMKKMMTRKELSQKARLSTPTIFAVERGEKISALSLSKICHALGVNFDKMYALMNEEE